MLNTVSQELAPLVAQLLVAVLSAATLAALTWIRQRVRSRLATDALSLLTTTAATLVAGAAEEVRSLKDPAMPGTWDQATAQRLRDRVVRDLRTLGAGALGDLKRTQGLDAEAVHQLLTQTVEAQVEALRRGAPMPPQTLTTVIERGTDLPRAPTAGQGGFARLGVLVLLVLLPLLAALMSCRHITDAAVVAAGGPHNEHCVVNADGVGPWRCNASIPEVCNASGRWWPSLARRADGTQRACDACALNSDGVSYCTAEVSP